MNSSFKAVAASFRMAPEKLTHQQEVCRLYRSSLKLLSSWVIDRGLWLDEAEKIRNQFDQNASLKAESGRAKFLLRKAHEKMGEYVHPDRYIVNYMPGGTLYMRNPPLPLHVCYPNGIPEEVQKELGGIEMDIDMTYAAPGKKSQAGRLYVDPTIKKML